MNYVKSREQRRKEYLSMSKAEREIHDKWQFSAKELWSDNYVKKERKTKQGTQPEYKPLTPVSERNTKHSKNDIEDIRPMLRFLDLMEMSEAGSKPSKHKNRAKKR